MNFGESIAYVIELSLALTFVNNTKGQRGEFNW